MSSFLFDNLLDFLYGFFFHVFLFLSAESVGAQQKEPLSWLVMSVFRLAFLSFFKPVYDFSHTGISAGVSCFPNHIEKLLEFFFGESFEGYERIVAYHSVNDVFWLTLLWLVQLRSSRVFVGMLSALIAAF